jgi:hypothetical protein
MLQIYFHFKVIIQYHIFACSLPTSDATYATGSSCGINETVTAVSAINPSPVSCVSACQSSASATSVATTSSSSRMVTSPNQPNIKYKKADCNRCFQFSWYARWPWLHWDDKCSYNLAI